MINKIFTVLLPLLFSVLLAACGAPATLTGPAVEGRVMNVQTNEPIAGAIVLLSWQARTNLPWTAFDGHTSDKVLCYRVETAVTDAQGRYHTQAWNQSNRYNLSNGNFSVIAYKRGYGQTNVAGSGGKYWVSGSGVDYWEQDSNKALKPDVDMKPFTGTMDERFERLIMHGDCSNADHSVWNAYPMVNAIYEEMKDTAETERQRIGLRNVEKYANSLRLRWKNSQQTKPSSEQ